MFAECPVEVNVPKFIRDRAEAVGNLLAVITNENLPKGEVSQAPRTFVQRLPRHMRRRAMSHNVKRFPRRQRAWVEGLTERRQKPPSRWRRRRPSNLLKVYLRRQGRCCWMETHIWHAKRFRMTELWGYKVPGRSYQRHWRASLRDARRHCVVQDVSYTVPIQVAGTQQALIDGLNKFCPDQLGTTFAALSTLRGQREGRVVLYHDGQYPFGCIGPCQFIWHPCDLPEPNLPRKIWLFVHPAIKSTVLQCIKMYLNLNEVETKLSDEDQPEVRSLPEHQLRRSAGEAVFTSGNGTEAVLLEHSFARFRLTGPLSSLVLRRALSVDDALAWMDKHEQANNSLNQWSKSGMERIRSHCRWWIGDASKRTPDAVGQGRVVSLLSADPRKTLSYTKTLPETDVLTEPIDNLTVLPDSCIWDSDYRMELLKKRLPDKEINESRQLPIVGARLPLSPEELLVPILLIHQTDRGQFGGGWDVLVPAGWSMTFWIAIQYATGRAVGLDVARRVDRESGLPVFPDDWPDTEAGLLDAERQSYAALAKHERRPIAKRINYNNLRIKYPFSLQWAELLAGWKDLGKGEADEQRFFVCRRMADVVEEHWALNALIPVLLKAVGRGVPRKFGLICMAEAEDKVPSVVNSEDNEAAVGRNEKVPCPLGTVTVQTEYGIERAVDFELLFPPSKVKKKKKKVALSNQMKHDSQSVKLFGNVVHTGRRKVIGFILSGDYSFLEGRGNALGLCSCLALRMVLSEPRRNEAFVLFRNTTSKYYHSALLRLLENK